MHIDAVAIIVVQHQHVISFSQEDGIVDVLHNVIIAVATVLCRRILILLVVVAAAIVVLLFLPPLPPRSALPLVSTTALIRQLCLVIIYVPRCCHRCRCLMPSPCHR
jgi:hypothetical protein